jgi:hypothetical protein
MAGLTCPNCNAVVSSPEITSGWCDSCGKKIPAAYAAALHTPKRTAREALMVHTQPTKRGRKRLIGTLIGTLLGALISAILMVGPLRGAGYILILFVTFAIMLAALSVGQIVDGMLVREHK